MGPASVEILKTWISSIKCGEVTQLLNDESVLNELDHGCDEVTALKAFSSLASKIFELKSKPLDTVFPSATPLHLFKLSDFLSALYIKNKTSDGKDENYIISLHHVILYFLKEGLYEFSFTLRRRIEEVGYGISSIKDEKQRSIIFSNFYLMFWNGSIELEKKGGDGDLVLKLRLTSIELLSYANPSKFPTLSERFIVTSRMYVAVTKDSVLTEAISEMFSHVLGIATPMANSFLSSDRLSDSQEMSVELTDSLAVCVKSYSEILIEVMRVHNLYSQGKAGLDLCIKYCKMCCGSGYMKESFNGFLDILCDIFSQVAVTTGEDDILRRGFHAIYAKLCEIQSLSDNDVGTKSEHIYCGIKFKSLSFLKASECVCRAIVDLWNNQNTDGSIGVCLKDGNSLMLLLELGGKLNIASDLPYSLKFMALHLRVVIHLLSIDPEDTVFGEYDAKVAKANEILIMCMNVEEKISSFQSNNSKAAVNTLIQVLPVAIQLFWKKKLFVTCEEFLMKYYKLISKWSHVVSTLKGNLWWCIQFLCKCRRDQKKFRAALAALTLAVESRMIENYSSVFNEWAKVKINAQVNDSAELKLSTIYHILKENVKGENMPFSNEEVSQLLKLELYAYVSRRVRMNNAVEDVCNTILEISDDVVLKAEAQLCLIEMSFTSGSSNVIFGETPMDSAEGAMKQDDMLDTLKTAFNSCLKLAANFQKEIRNAAVSDNVPAMLCVLGHAYYLMYLCKCCLNRKKAKNEINGDGSIPLQVPRKIDVISQEETVEDGASSCDIVPSQLSLKSSKQKQLLNSTLDVAVALWEHAVEKGMKNADQEKFNIIVILKSIETSANIYELYDDLWHNIKAWCLFCRYADIFMKDESYVLGISNLMRKGGISVNSKCLLRVDNIAAKLDENSPLLFTYLLGKCWQLLYASEFSAGLSILRRVLKDCSPAMGKWHSVLYAQSKYLLALYCIQSPADINDSELSKDPVFRGCTRYDAAISALSTLIRLLGEWKDSGSLSLFTFSQVLLLDIGQWIGELFLELNISREAYAYLKQQFLVTQKLLLPNRTVQCLTTLAFVDLMSCRKSDCEVKLLGMESIIDLDHEKDGNQQLGDIEKLIHWLGKGKGGVKKSNPDSSEVILFTDVGDVAKAKNKLGRYSPERPGSNYKFVEMKKCINECFCEWCVSSGFQKAFLGLRAIQVCIANKSQSESLSPSAEIFENSNRLLRGIISRFKVMVSRMSKFYFPLLLSEEDLAIDLYLDSSDFVIDFGRLHALYMHFILGMADFYLAKWENSDASSNEFLNKSGTLISVVEEEAKNIKYICGLQFLMPRIAMVKLIVGKAKMMPDVSQFESCNKEEEEFRLWEKGRAQPEVFKTPSKETGNASQLRKVDDINGDEDDVIYEPIPSVPKRYLPRRNLYLNFKEEEHSQSGESRRVAGIGVETKKVANIDSKTSKLKKEIADGSKNRDVKKKNLDASKVRKDFATNATKSGVAKNDAGEKVVGVTLPRRRPCKK